MKRTRGQEGGKKPRTMVVTITEAVPLPEANTFGLTAQVVAVAVRGREQDKLTCDENPLWAVTEITFVKVAVWPAATVTDVVPDEVMEKSGGAVTMKLNGADAPAAIGSTTESG